MTFGSDIGIENGRSVCSSEYETATDGTEYRLAFNMTRDRAYRVTASARTAADALTLDAVSVPGPFAAGMEGVVVTHVAPSPEVGS